MSHKQPMFTVSAAEKRNSIKIINAILR